MSAPSNPNPEPQVDTPPNPNPPPQVDPPKPPDPPKGPNFDPDNFFNKLDTQLKGFGEQMVTSIKEAFPAPEPPKADPPKTDPPKSDPPKADPQPNGGDLPFQQRFVNWWFKQ